MEVTKDRSHRKSSDDVQEEDNQHTTTRRLIQEVPSDPEFPIQPITSHENRVVHTNVKITGRVQPCEDVKGDPKATPEERSVDGCHQTASDNLTGFGQLSECNGHGRDVMLTQTNRNVEELPFKLVHDKKKRDQYPRPLVQDTADQCEYKNTVNTEKDTSENDKAPVQNTDENCQPLVQDTRDRDKTSLPNSCIPQHQIVPGLRPKENKSFFQVMMYALFSVYRPNLVGRMMYLLFSVCRPNGPNFVGRMMYALYSVYRPNGPYLVGPMMYMLFSVYRPNGPYFVSQMMYALFSVYQPNGTYFVGRMMYAQNFVKFSVYRPNGTHFFGRKIYVHFSVYLRSKQYFVTRMMIMQHIILCHDQACVLFTWKACMKLIYYFLMEDFNVTRKGCFLKSEQQKYKKEIIETAQLYGQKVKVYAVVVNNYGDGEFIQNQQQYQPDPVEVLDGPIQHPAQNDTGVLAISVQESPLQMYNQDQPQHHPDLVEVLEGPIQHPQQNDAAVLAITHQEPIPNINDQQQLPNDHVAVVVNGDLIPQLTLVIAVTVVVIAILIKIFYLVTL